jgi:hypothetical protein
MQTLMLVPVGKKLVGAQAMSQWEGSQREGRQWEESKHPVGAAEQIEGDSGSRESCLVWESTLDCRHHCREGCQQTVLAHRR